VDLFKHAAGKGAPGEQELTLEGTVDRIVFSGGESAFTVARLKLARGAGGASGTIVTVVGSLLGVPAGAALRVQGRYETTARFGEQFRVVSYTEVAPATLDGIRRYLGSGLIKGIGPEFAGRIVERFGIETLEILDSDPTRISEVPGIGPARAKSIRAAWSAQREVRKVMVFLQGYGVSPAFAARIYKRYGERAIALVRENPYRLAFDVWGIGFRSADTLASALGIKDESDVRVEAGVRHVIQESSTNGDVFVPRERLVRQAVALLTAPAADGSPRADVTEKMADAAVDRLARTGDVIVDPTINVFALDTGAAVYDADLNRAERAVAEGLRKLLAGRAAAVEIDVPRALAWYEHKAGITLARQQAEAVALALTGKVSVVTGGPGVGKTTIVRGIVSILARKGLRISLAAPTGRAAKRLADQAGVPASTLHRLLEWRPHEGVFARNATNALDCDLLVVDEASMLDVRLAADLLASLAPSTRLVLVGDVDQLPSVGPGRVLRDVIDSGAVPTVRLTEIFRQAAESLIVTNAHRIHDGEMPDLGAPPPTGAGPGDDKRDFFFIEEDDPAKAALLVRDLVATRLPRRYGLQPHEIQVLAPMHRGELGAGNLNQLLQEALTAGAPGLQRGARLYRVGDKVMQVRNDYDKEVWNGDIGVIARAEISDGAGSLTVRFEERDGDREVEYDSDELDELALAYAATVHKSQGSEYAAVVVPVHTQHFVMLQRNLLYTAVTRGKRLVVLVGSRKALGIAVRNADVGLRCSGLAHRLATPS
jgi:exodeoxyribonuclease V alpha subunit